STVFLTTWAAPADALTCGPGCTALTFSVNVIEGTDTFVSGGHVVSVSHDLFTSNEVDPILATMIAADDVGAGGLFQAPPPAYVRNHSGALALATTSDFLSDVATPTALLTTTGAVLTSIPGGNSPVTALSDVPPALLADLLSVNPGTPVISETLSSLP